MESTSKLADRIVEKVHEAPYRDVAIEWVDQQIRYHIQDALKLIKNINETSMNEADRQKRIIAMEDEFGISKTHIL